MGSSHYIETIIKYDNSILSSLNRPIEGSEEFYCPDQDRRNEIFENSAYY